MTLLLPRWQPRFHNGGRKNSDSPLCRENCETFECRQAESGSLIIFARKKRHDLQIVNLVLVTLVVLIGCNRSDNESKPATAGADAIRRVTEKGPVKLTVSVTPPEPRLSDLVEMDVQVTAEPDVDIRPPAFGEAVGDFLVRDYTERTAKTSENGETHTRLFHYQLEPVHSGIHLIRSVAIEFVDNRDSSEAKGKAALIESDPIEIKVISEFGNEVPDLANLEPMLPPKPIDQSSGYWWAGSAVLLIASVLLFLRYRRQRGIREQQPPPRTPREIADAAMKQLLAEDLPSRGLFKEFYVRLTGIVRVYIEGTTGVRAPEQTTEEFLCEMRSKDVFHRERSAQLAEFLEAADMVKYAGQQPKTEQIKLSISRAMEFVRAAESVGQQADATQSGAVAT